jgi:ElaB/YqjD/DUF883 family membrane-anchored ribosome-binding protein
MLTEILSENQAMLADVGQEMGEAANAAMRSNDQLVRDIFGEGVGTALRRPARRERGAGRPVRRELPASRTRLIEDGAIDAELIEDDSRMYGRSNGRNVPDAIEAEIVTETADRGAQIIRQTGAAVRGTAHLSRPRSSATELAAQAIEDMHTEQEAIIAEQRAELEKTMAYIRGKV